MLDFFCIIWRILLHAKKKGEMSFETTKVHPD